MHPLCPCLRPEQPLVLLAGAGGFCRNGQADPKPLLSQDLPSLGAGWDWHWHLSWGGLVIEPLTSQAFLFCPLNPRDWFKAISWQAPHCRHLWDQGPHPGRLPGTPCLQSCEGCLGSTWATVGM